MLQKKNKENWAYLKGNKIWLDIDERNLTLTKELSKMPGCKYHVMKSQYELPLTWPYVEILISLNILFDKALREWERETRNEQNLKQTKLKNIPGLQGTLYPYQMLGVQWIDICNGRALIADAMRVGKTVQALAWCQLHKNIKPRLIICPSIAKVNWAREAKKWMSNVNVQILESQTPYEITGDFVIINYDIIHHWALELQMYDFQVVIVDEAHFLKSSSSKRTKAFKKLTKYIPNMIALTGTAIENSPVEIFTIVNALNPTVFPDYVKFTKEFCGGKIGDRGKWEAKGATNTIELFRILTRTVMIRRTLREVIKDLPETRVCTLPLEITNRKEYKQAENQFITFLNEKFKKDLVNKEDIEKELKAYAKKHELEVSENLTGSDIKNIGELKIEKAKAAPILTQMAHLEQLAVQGKMEAIVEWIKEFLKSGDKLVVFAINKVVITYLMKHFPDASRLDGSVISKKKRQEAIDRFQNNPKVQLFIANIQSGGIAITLDAAHDLAIIQYPWNPGKLAQASARVLSVNQKHKVTIWNIVASNTIEEKKLLVLQEKEKIMNDVLDGGKTSEASIASEVLRMYKPR